MEVFNSEVIDDETVTESCVRRNITEPKVRVKFDSSVAQKQKKRKNIP